MGNSEILLLLERHGVKVTPNRVLVAMALADAKRPLSMTELEDKIESVDKSGIFRTLEIFKEHHLVHAIEGGSEGTRYELCLSEDGEHDDDTHVHFYCEKCHKTFCFKDTHIPSVALPEGYEATGVSYVIKGICPDCAKLV
jgi:Fur family ferric uptake transcriptional regulator